MSGALTFSADTISAQIAPDFEKLVGAQGWAQLCPAIRRRFSDHDLRVTYEGRYGCARQCCRQYFRSPY